MFAYYDFSHLPDPTAALDAALAANDPSEGRHIITDPLPFASEVAHDLLAMEMQAVAGEPPA